MKDMWTALEERTRGLHALDRQGVADAVWSYYVTARFARTGDPRALQFLYPYLNLGERTKAIAVAARVFEGRGPQAIGQLDYFTRSTDSYVRDRAVVVVGATVNGWPENVVLETLAPYLNHRNQFTQRLAMSALSKATAGSANGKILSEFQRVAKESRAPQNDIDHAIARVFSGHPTEEAYCLVARPDAKPSWMGLDTAVGTLVRGASDEWYERACREFFEPRLHVGDETTRWPQFVHRAAVEGLSHAARGRGMEPLRKALHLAQNRVTCKALMESMPQCFDGADQQSNRKPLLQLCRSADVQKQRVAAVCLGRLVAGAEETEAICVLKDLCRAKHGGVRSGALTGLGMAARSTCDEELGRLCLELAEEGETAKAAIHALGEIFRGSGRFDVFDDIRNNAEMCRNRPTRGRTHSRPLVACYNAIGLLYQGTGSMEPMDFLLDALVPSPVKWCPYRWAAGEALVTIEFSERALARTFGDSWS